jgi:uncharacterized membrane protein
MNRPLTIGLTLIAGAAVIEAALIPAAVIGAAAVLAPRYLPGLGRRMRPVLDAVARRAGAAATPRRAPAAGAPPSGAAPTQTTPAKLRIGQAVAKTITFRIIVTTLDFTTNLLVIGELNTAAGLSAFNLVAGPLLYLGHEAAWNYYGPPETEGIAIGKAPPQGTRLPGGFRISRALAKTVTFRTIASVVDFTVTYVVVRDVATAAGLSAFGFFIGPFVYFAHERAWDYFTTPREDVSPRLPPPTRLLPAPA